MTCVSTTECSKHAFSGFSVRNTTEEGDSYISFNETLERPQRQPTESVALLDYLRNLNPVRKMWTHPMTIKCTKVYRKAITECNDSIDSIKNKKVWYRAETICQWIDQSIDRESINRFQAKMPNVRIYSYSFFYITVNWLFWGFGLLVEQNIYRRQPWTLGNCDGHFSLFLDILSTNQQINQ